MCGIAGYIHKDIQSKTANVLQQLLSAIETRGPDDQGIVLINRRSGEHFALSTPKTNSEVRDRFPMYQNEQILFAHDLAFLHTRFSILDLSSKSHQPFFADDHSLVLVFNGEIYNFLELKEELIKAGRFFQTPGDTEVLAQGYRHWGDDLWAKLNGFWAVALYDFKNKELILVRDRIGVAPLYYREFNRALYFSSTIQSLINISPTTLTINKDVVYGFIEEGIKDHDYLTYYQEIRSLPPATVFKFRLDHNQIPQSQSFNYWKLPSRRLAESEISLPEAAKKFREIFFNAVSIRMRSDVPIAFELSGGLDSSCVVAAASEISKSPISVYTLRIAGADEEMYARAMLKRYKIDYHVLANVESDFENQFENFSKIMEEPYDNPNAFVHHQMLWQMKKENKDVVITGAGGDEVFAGYESQFWPKAYQELKNQGLSKFIHGDWYEFRRRFRNKRNASATINHYVKDSLKIFFRSSINAVQESAPVVNTAAHQYRKKYRQLSFHQQSMFHFQVGLLPFYMRSSDHFTMGIPIEHRFPFLDYRMVEFGLQLPITYLFSAGWTKYILRQAMATYLPKEILWRKRKMGFDFPFRKYFESNAKIFKPWITSVLFKKFKENNYDFLVKQNPEMLWRIISTSVWLKQSPVSWVE